MGRSKIVLWVIFLLSAHGAYAQYTLYQHITVKDGLPSDYVMSMMFDRQGIFWIGTDKGLCRFDGSSMQILTMDEGLGSNTVYTIYQDLQGDIWIGGYESGIAKIGIDGNIISVEKVLKRGMTISDLKQDDTGTYWIKTTLPGSSKYQYWRTKDIELAWDLVVTYDGYNQLIVDAKGTIWYCSTAEIVWTNTGDIKNKLVPKSKDDSIQIISSGKKTLIKGKDYGYIISTNGEIDSLSFVPALLGGINCRFLSTLHYDVLYKTGRQSYLYNQGILSETIGDASNMHEQFFFFTAAADAYGNIYFSHFGEGILVWRTPYIHQYEVPNKVHRIAVNSKQVHFVVGSELFEIESPNRKMRSMQKVKLDELVYSGIDGNAQPILGTGYGYFNIQNKMLYNGQPKFLDISDILIHESGLYLSSYSFGIQKLKNHMPDTAWNKALRLSLTSIERLRLYEDTLYALSLSDGVTAIDIHNAGSRKMDKANGLLSNSVYEVYREADTLWIGTAHGVTKMVKTFTQTYGAEQGFHGKRAVSIFRDRQKRIWVLSDTYLHLYQDNALLPVRSHPVITDNRAFIITAKYQTETNTLWIGTNRSLLAVSMDYVTLNTESYEVSVRNVFLGNKQVDFSHGILYLDNNHEPFRVFFANPHYSIYTQPLVYTRLLGFDDQWKLLNAEFLLEYNKLPAGDYILEVKTAGPDIGKTPVKQLLHFQVLPPWWKRTWMIIAYMLIASGVAFGMSRLMAKRKYQKKLMQIEAEQALQLERSRISRELHDNVGSMLTVMINRMEDEPVLQVPQQVSITDIARNTLSQLRDAIWALDKNSVTLAQWMNRSSQYLHQLQSNGTTIQTTFDWPENASLSPVKALHSFRILQEACTNAMKHAKPTKILVNGFTDQQYLMLIVQDIGQGFDVKDIKYGYGLKNMMKRAGEMGGTLEVNSMIDAGTTITLRWLIT